MSSIIENLRGRQGHQSKLDTVPSQKIFLKKSGFGLDYKYGIPVPNGKIGKLASALLITSGTIMYSLPIFHADFPFSVEASNGKPKTTDTVTEIDEMSLTGNLPTPLDINSDVKIDNTPAGNASQIGENFRIDATQTPDQTPTPVPSKPKVNDTGKSQSEKNNENEKKDETCGGKYKPRQIPLGNFGDPDCDFSMENARKLLEELDSKNVTVYINEMIPRESSKNPNAYNPNSTAKGACGLVQMSCGTMKNGKYDNGKVPWREQLKNAVNYEMMLERSSLAWRYWDSLKHRWGKR